ncbi:MAG: four-carbon acid sugar kinase family protein, partial [Synergistaceae bacterium]|nr:four-carbon acid sugar kinase family protein [Synergistaceae bacterium]
MLKSYLLVADDFTGANDTGVQMRRRGLDTFVVLAGRRIPNPREGAAVVIDTESRGLSQEEAAHRVAEAVKGLDLSAYSCVVKKVDSTLRGNVAAEIRALDAAFGSELVIFAPALPDLGRITEGGVHKLNGVPISQTEIAKDPKKPVVEDNLQRLLQAACDEPIGYVGLDSIRGGRIDLSGARLFACDAVQNSDLRT